jgi:hypothetical protein
MNVILQKLANEVLHGSGNTNTPEPEDLKEEGLKEIRVEIHPTNGLRSTKPIPNRNRPNRTFHRYCSELWSIRAGRVSVCPYCKQAISPGEEITLFDSQSTWSHLYHATTEAAPLEA